MPDKHDTDNAIEAARSLIDRGQPELALERLQAQMERVPEDAEILMIAGRALNNSGRIPEAVDAFRRAVALDPGDVNAVSNLGHVLARLGDQPGAEDAWHKALKLDPDHLRSLKGLAGLLAGRQRYERAADLLRRVAGLTPEDPDNWLNLAELLQFLDRPTEAEAALRQAAELAPGRAEIHGSLGRLLYSGGEVEAASDAYSRALECDPGNQAAAAGRALCLEITGGSAEAMELLIPFISSPEPAPMVDFAAGRLLTAAGRHEEALTHIQRAVAAEDPDWQRIPLPWYALGTVLERLGRYDEAFEAWSEANRLKPARFDAAEYRGRVDRIIGWHDAARISAWPPAVPESRAVVPLFIVGMPRSGTTLVEQVLACHPQIRAGGERLLLENAAAAMWQESRRVSTDDPAELETLRAHWLADAGTSEAGVTYCTDKFPGNFMHLGLLRRVLPEARVIWCLRDPADTAVSIFANDFNRRIVPWATRLEHIAVAWDAHIRLMEHWAETLGLPLLIVRYESLVADFENGVRAMLDFLALPWEPSCMDFHRSGRLANTASFEQVRRPVYDTSVGRSRNFERRLRPFLDAIPR